MENYLARWFSEFQKGECKMKEIIVAYCGLICSECGAFKKGRCKGCFGEKPMNKNCKIKRCNVEKKYSTCADCTEFANIKDCKKLNNFISKIFHFLFKSNRLENLEKIRKDGLEKFKE